MKLRMFIDFSRINWSKEVYFVVIVYMRNNKDC